MKDIVNKKGFTLIELLATIALLALLVVFVVPQVYKLLYTGYDESFALQEKEVVDAAILYIEDYCKSPINANYAKDCVLKEYTYINEDGFVVYYGNIKLSNIINAGYISNISFRNKPCNDKSYITISENGEVKAYLKCENSSSDENPFITKGYDDDEFYKAK